MYSLSRRLLITVSVLLLLFFGITVAVLDTAFTEAGEQARRDILDGHVIALLAAAEPDADAQLALPDRLREPRFGQIGSGLYGELRDESGSVIWRSRSALGLRLPDGDVPKIGYQLFAREVLSDGSLLLTLSLVVDWEFNDGQSKTYLFKVGESLDSFNAQITSFRRQLFGWFAAVAVTMLLAFSLLLRGLLKPLRQIESEIGEIEGGSRASLSDEFPTELTGVARNMNVLIDSERARSERYRSTLDNLAHSLKTPLAAMRALLEDRSHDNLGGRLNAQIDRMDEIVRYQLRKPAAVVTDQLVRQSVNVDAEVERLIDGLKKVYHDKGPKFLVSIESDTIFRGDCGDFLELAGNLLDNACKWCKSAVRIEVESLVSRNAAAGGMVLSVCDDGPGIPQDAADVLLRRGMRLDESTPGHGIGLAVVNDIAHSYGGQVSIGKSNLGGAKITVTIPSRTSVNKS